MEASNLAQFFSGIEKRLDQSREAQKDAIRGFFINLIPRFEAAKKFDEEMNRKSAYRFNALDYLRTDEIGLSRIIADLFNPKATHGQGTYFLRSFLCELHKQDNCNVDSHWLDLDFERVNVKREKETKTGRKIDIYVTIDDKYCLAIENKPFADDQPRQLADYLEHLAGKYDKEKFVLIYLPSRGQRPSESSLPRSEYARWKSRFKIMAYYNEPEIICTKSESADELADYRISFSLADWISECSKDCQVDRLQTFLLDTKQFCEKRFGGLHMTENGEKKALKEYIYLDRNHLEIAQSICTVWPEIIDEICKMFLNRMCALIKSRITEKQENLICDIDNIEIAAHHGKKHGLSITLKSWKEYNVDSRHYPKAVSSRIGIWMESQSGINDWWLGVATPYSSENIKKNGADYNRYLELKESLYASHNLKELGLVNEDRLGWWPCYKSAKEEYQNWSRLIPDLHEECKTDNGANEIACYFVDEMVEIASTAIPIIDKIEGGENLQKKAD